MQYYNKNGIVVCDAGKEDIQYLKNNLRKSDVDEIWASHHVTPEYALTEGLRNSSICLTIKNEKPLSMFGICPENLLGTRAVLWLLATENLMDVKLEFIRYSRKFINLMIEQYPLLYNWVDARNVKSVYWLKKIGADLKNSEPYGVDKMPFHYFEFARS